MRSHQTQMHVFLVCVFTYVCRHAHMHIHMHHAYAQTRIHMSALVCAYMYYVYVYVYVCYMAKWTCIHMNTYTYTFTYRGVQIYSRIHVYLFAHVDTRFADHMQQLVQHVRCIDWHILRPAVLRHIMHTRIRISYVQLHPSIRVLYIHLHLHAQIHTRKCVNTSVHVYM